VLDAQGRVVTEYYPHALKDSDGSIDLRYPTAFQRIDYGYDQMDRQNVMKVVHFRNGQWRQSPQEVVTMVAGVAFKPSGQIEAISGYMGVETRQYNALQQLTRLTVVASGTTRMDMEYVFPASGNAGRIEKAKDWDNNSEVTYQYDALNRLMTASSTGGSVWSHTYTYDGFGNLTNQAPGFNLTVNPLTNRVSNWVYDANGNLLSDGPGRAFTYDVENRLVTAQGQNYAYDISNRRVFAGEEYTFWTPDGLPILRYKLAPLVGAAEYRAERTNIQVYFGGRLVATANPPADANLPFAFEPVVTDRLGSVRARGGQKFQYYPYGQENTVTPNGQPKFGTYFRDTGTGLDYANQRYYAPGFGRFMTVDPSPGSSRGVWNQYAYVGGDPINRNDPSGLLTVIIGGTVLNPFADSNAAWGQPGTPFNESVSRFFGEKAVVYEWSGKLFDRIFSGALGLRDFINAHTFRPGEKLNIIAHSHGGNVVKAYTGMDSRFIDTFITLGTPQRSDFKIFRWRVGTYLNVYSKHDWIQKSGGPWYFFLMPFAGRTDRSAINIGIDRAYGLGQVGHSELHTPEVWCEMEQWLLRAGYRFGEARSGSCGGGSGGFTPRQPEGLDEIYDPDQVIN
jgi:RHS repeat-associated protein